MIKINDRQTLIHLIWRNQNECLYFASPVIRSLKVRKSRYLLIATFKYRQNNNNISINGPDRNRIMINNRMSSKSSSECENHWSNNTYCARTELLKTSITKRHLWDMINIIHAKQINVKRTYLILTRIAKAILWSNKYTTPTAANKQLL